MARKNSSQQQQQQTNTRQPATAAAPDKEEFTVRIRLWPWQADIMRMCESHYGLGREYVVKGLIDRFIDNVHSGLLQQFPRLHLGGDPEGPKGYFPVSLLQRYKQGA